MSDRRIIGVSPWSNPNYELMREAGIGWVRLGFDFPYRSRLGGEYAEKFTEDLENARRVAGMGFKIMGVTPLAGVMAYDKGDNMTAWRPHVPEWLGGPGAEGYYDGYERGCEELGRQTRGLVQMWQVSNEMDIDVFRGPLTREQAARFMLAGARGIRKGNPEALPGINPAVVSDESRWLYRELYGRPDTPFGYAGIDGYFGSWQPGSPQDWIPWIEEIHDITKQDVLINEWGYSSLGRVAAPPKGELPPGVNAVCVGHAWTNVWRGAHDPEVQAAYLRIGLKIFATYPHVLGSFIYDWGDDAVCYHCGQADCPSECGWGIVDSQGQPKAGYYAVKETVMQYYR
jgi:hypothetical protein